MSIPRGLLLLQGRWPLDARDHRNGRRSANEPIEVRECLPCSQPVAGPQTRTDGAAWNCVALQQITSVENMSLPGRTRPAERPAREAPGRRRPLIVMLVDDHSVVRAGLKDLLEATGEINVVAEAATESDAVSEAVRTAPDVIVMDVRLAAGDGISATRAIKAQLPDTKILILTAFLDDAAVAGSIEAGASGFLLKEVRGGDIVSSVRAAARGELLFDQNTAHAALIRLRRGKHLRDDRLATLSPQEERILEQIARGLTNREIADKLDLAEKTVKNYVSNVLLKLDVDRRAEAAVYFSRRTASKG